MEYETAPIETSEMETIPNDFDMAPADFGAEIEPAESDSFERDAPESDAPESDAPESDAPESDVPESDVPESDVPESDSAESGVPVNDTAESDSGEMAPAEIDRALDEIEKELAEVERVLDRLGDGSYGLCQTCGDPLTEEELETSPAGRLCRAHLPFDQG